MRAGEDGKDEEGETLGRSCFPLSSLNSFFPSSPSLRCRPSLLSTIQYHIMGWCSYWSFGDGKMTVQTYVVHSVASCYLCYFIVMGICKNFHVILWKLLHIKLPCIPTKRFILSVGLKENFISSFNINLLIILLLSGNSLLYALHQKKISDDITLYVMREKDTTAAVKSKCCTSKTVLHLFPFSQTLWFVIQETFCAKWKFLFSVWAWGLIFSCKLSCNLIGKSKKLSDSTVLSKQLETEI